MPMMKRLRHRCIFLLLPAWFGAFHTQVAPAASLAEAEAKFRAGEYADCLRICDEGIAEAAWQESWRHLKVEAAAAVGQYDVALASARAALDVFPASLRIRWLAHSMCLYADEPEESQRMLDQMHELIRDQRWRYANSADMILQGRYFLRQGADAREVLEVFYDRVKKAHPSFAETYLATGELALAKHDYALAAEAFNEAARLLPEDPAVHWGRARAYAPSDEEVANTALSRALELNPRHIGSLLMLADGMVDAERYDEARQLLDRSLAVNPHHPEACAYHAVLAHLDGDREAEQRWRERALEHWRTNPAVDSLIGRKLSQKYRFAEGAAYQRRALVFDPRYVPAQIQLAQDLLRLGRDDEGWQLAGAVHEEDSYNVAAYNLAVLRQSLGGFTTLESDGFRLRMESREADLYGQAALALLRRARDTLCPKYGVELGETVTVEIYPEQKDFAVRTFGMPGGAGFLGVCFGSVITANSPSSQGERPANWQSVLWHEFCHVVTLQKTRNKMPRWLSEGISVYEERQADPAWGESLDAIYRRMILQGELTPVSRLSSAFLQPPSPLHLQFAYFESSLVVEFLIEKYGLAALQRILDDLAADLPINAALERNVGSLGRLDEEFAVYARERAESLAAGADWEPAEVSVDADTETLAAWVSAHPDNLDGLRQLAQRRAAAGDLQAARKSLEELVRLYPDDVSENGGPRLLAGMLRRLGDAAGERAMLESLAARDDDAMDAYRRLIELCEAEQDWAGVAKNAERLLAVNPLLPAPHRQLAAAAERLGDPARATQSYRALLRIDPIDPADLHYRLARVLADQGEMAAARREALKALEEAPRFRSAHHLLLEIVDRERAGGASREPVESAGEDRP